MSRTLRLAASILFFLVACAPGLPAAGAAPATATVMRHVEVKGVILDPRNNQPVVLLEDQEGGTILPIWVGPSEAQAIMMELKGVMPPRPMTHDLMRNIIGSLKGEVLRVVITELKGGTFYAFIDLKTPERSFSVDSRPSDAIALALRTKAPIFAKREVMETGISPEPETKLTHRNRLGLILQAMTPTLARFFGGGKVEGLLVSQVEDGAPAAQAGLQRGDVIYEVEGEAVTSLQGFEQAFVKRNQGMVVSVRRGAKGESLQLRIPLTSSSEGKEGR